MCSLASDCMQNGTGTQQSTNVMIINGLTVVFYVGIWLLLKFRAHNSTTVSKSINLTLLESFYPFTAALPVELASCLGERKFTKNFILS
jgi:hypothetical protein